MIVPMKEPRGRCGKHEGKRVIYDVRQRTPKAIFE
jgi:hypothetical protein